MTVSDEIVLIGNRFYIKATATITDEEGNTETVSAYSREDEALKGMSSGQITGATSSYARKYCLNGLFLIDDTKDIDSEEFQSASKTKTKLTKTFLKEHGSERITGDEIAKLKKACLNAGESMSLERALTACKKSSIEEITYFQYVALMNQLGAVA